MSIVTFDESIAYVWWKTQFGKTQLTFGHVVKIPNNEIIKMTLWAKSTDRFLNKGTCIFIVTGGGDGKLSFSEPQFPSDTGGISPLTKAHVPGAATLNSLYWGSIKPLLKKGYLEGFNRHAIIDWEWPYCMPGWHGIPEIEVAVPGWKRALEWLEWHALGILGGKTFTALSENVKKSAVGIAVGGIGYLTGLVASQVNR